MAKGRRKQNNSKIIVVNAFQGAKRLLDTLLRVANRTRFVEAICSHKWLERKEK